jgi:hypothetical protein
MAQLSTAPSPPRQEAVGLALGRVFDAVAIGPVAFIGVTARQTLQPVNFGRQSCGRTASDS